MPLYCIELKQSDTDMFLVEAPTEKAAIDDLREEIRLHGTPDRKRFAGGSISHTANDYEVKRRDDPMDLASWERHTGGTLELHGNGFNYRPNEIALLVRDGVIYRCEQCSPSDGRQVYHAIDGRLKLDDIHAALRRRSHYGIAVADEKGQS